MNSITPKTVTKRGLISFARVVLGTLLLCTFAAMGQTNHKKPHLPQNKSLNAEKVYPDDCLAVYNGIQQNESNFGFVIKCIEKYPNNYLQVFNRWGTKVYDMKGYDNTWDGLSTGVSAMGAQRKLPIGTYFYTLDLGIDKPLQKEGWIYIVK